ncbi:MAG TPA: hypothetical protein V6D03_10945 [Candidatus Caenarcaniphilales bacterium]
MSASLLEQLEEPHPEGTTLILGHKAQQHFANEEPLRDVEQVASRLVGLQDLPDCVDN